MCAHPAVASRRWPAKTPPLLALLAAAVWAGPAAPAEGAEPLFQPRLVLGVDIETERNLDLDSGRRDGETGVEAITRLSVDIARGRRVSGVLDVEWRGERVWERDEKRQTDRALILNRAFLRIDDVGLERVNVRLGRWPFRDRREWIIDKTFDGLHASVRRDGWRIDALAGRRNLAQRDLLQPDRRGDPINHHALLMERDVSDAVTLGANAVFSRALTDARDRLLTLGLRAFGDGGGRLDWWADAALSAGREDARRVFGYGFDVGGTWTFSEAPWRPRVTLGLAHGSGGDEDGDGVDRAFRQTGLQSNEARRGGLAKVKHYGEALDPDLSNLTVLTAGIGASPARWGSIDLMYHRYRQPRPGQDIRGSNLARDPFRQGDAEVGQAVDVVAGLRPADGVRIEGAVGWFRPGPAFRRRDDALVARLEMRLAF